MPIEEQNRIKSLFPCIWDSPSVAYLGVQLTSSSAKLYSCNYPPLLANIEEEMDQIHKLHLSWMGRIAAYQMQILPKLLYHFRTLLIPIPQTFFLQLTNKLKKFIWAGKKPRIALTQLYKPKYLGGVGLPNAHVYYQVAILEQSCNWFSCQTDNRWSEIEQEITPGHDLPALLIAACLHHRPESPPYPTIQVSIAALSSMLKLSFTDTPMQEMKTQKIKMKISGV